METDEKMGMPMMKEAIGAYRHVSATDEFRELERTRSYARHNKTSAIGHAINIAELQARLGKN